MNLPLAFLVNVALLVRLPLLLSDERVRGRRVLAAAAVQLVALLAFAPSRAVMLVAFVIILVNGLTWWWEQRRAVGGLMRRRLVTLAVWVVGFAALCSPFLALQFRSDLGSLADCVGMYFVPVAWLKTVPWSAFHSYLFGALLSLNEANLLVRLLIETFVLRPAGAAPQPPQSLLLGREYSRGRIIGLLERLLVFSLVLQGEYGAFGLIIATKGLARFKNLDDREFAEYFLVGTMLSIILAGGIAVIIRSVVP
jgi:hypothetical protein